MPFVIADEGPAKAMCPTSTNWSTVFLDGSANTNESNGFGAATRMDATEASAQSAFRGTRLAFQIERESPARTPNRELRPGLLLNTFR
jgi:hypothetical protein